MKFYECGICDHLHYWDFAGDCRDDRNRFTNDVIEPDDEVLSWQDRLDADTKHNPSKWRP